jgi:putative NADH-flavin reductase
MKLTIFGTTGGTGTQLAEQALAAGHEVTAVVRDPARLTVRTSSTTPLHVIAADIMDPASIIQAVTGADAVLTAIGPRGAGATTVSQGSVRSIIAAMQKAAARRLLTVSGSIVADDGESPYLRLIKPVVRRTSLRHVCADMRAAEAEVEATDLDWTILRPPRLTEGPATGRYRTRIGGGLPRSLTVSRADLAACMLSAIGDPATVRKHVAVAH